MPHPSSSPQSLKEALKAEFYPFAEKQGFERLRRNGSHNVTFRRLRGESVDVFEVQWDPDNRPLFVLDLGQFDAARGERKGIDANNCDKPVRLQRSGGASRSAWFQVKKPLLEVLGTRSLTYTPGEVMAQLMAQFPQAEAWWQGKVEGPDVRAMG